MDTFKKLQEIAKNHISFHTPGHNGKEVYDIKANLDITELSFSDNLLSPSGCIKEAEEKIAKIYSIDKALLYTNGATSCVQTVFAAMQNKAILIVGEAHKSIFNIIKLLKIRAYYSSSYEEIEGKIKENNIEVLFVTYPNYFGETTNVDLLRKLKEQYGLILIIDSSHGSHFAFSNSLPLSATKFGDIVIYSLHKTLPCYTGTALICTKKLYYEELFYYRQIFHTSSPFYPSIIRANNALAEYSKIDYYKFIKIKIDDFKAKLNKHFCLVKNADFSRMVIKTDFSSVEVENCLNRNNIYIEMIYQDLLILIVTPNNMDDLDKVASILNQLQLETISFKKISFKKVEFKKLEHFSKVDFLSFEKAKNHILAKEIGIYPPGVPLFLSGETIDEETLIFLKENKNSLFGLVNDKVVVVK